MRVRKEFEKQCAVCGARIVTASQKTMYCEDCRRAKDKEYKKRYVNNKRAKCREAARKHAESVAPSGAKSIHAVCKELEAYNASHGTRLTYGRYVAMMEGKENG